MGDQDDEVLAVLGASAGRRGLGLTVLWLLGAMLIWIALMRPPDVLALQATLIGLGLGALWLGERMRRATALAVELTSRGLRTSDGEKIADMGEIAAVDRGAFAFKPSHGFILRLRAGAGARWQPGLWWRLGRRVGVGGVTPGAQAKAMADLIATRIARR